VLEELELQDHGHWRRPKSPGLNADHGSDSDAALNPGRGLLDKVRTDGMQHHRHILHPAVASRLPDGQPDSRGVKRQASIADRYFVKIRWLREAPYSEPASVVP
jgi:hypothetical protein